MLKNPKKVAALKAAEGTLTLVPTTILVNLLYAVITVSCRDVTPTCTFCGTPYMYIQDSFKQHCGVSNCISFG